MKNILKNVGKKLFPSLLLAATIQAPALAQVQLLDQVVAIVDNDVVMLTELEERVEHIADWKKAVPKHLPEPSWFRRFWSA